MSVAYPISLFRDLHFRFDESLNTAEDWEFTTRAAQLCGVACDPSITAVYRWWDNGNDSSRSEHTHDQWKADRARILAKVNNSSLILPPGSLARIVALSGDLEIAKSMSNAANTEHASMQQQDVQATAQAREHLVMLLQSRSWRKTRHLRKWLRKLRGKNKQDLKLDNLPLTRAGLEHEIAKIRRSSSWRITRPLRWVAKMRAKYSNILPPGGR